MHNGQWYNIERSFQPDEMNQILKNQEDAEFGRKWKQFLEDNPMILKEYPEYSKIVERLKKRMEEVKEENKRAIDADISFDCLDELQKILGDEK